MTKRNILLSLSIAFICCSFHKDFLTEQIKYERVRSAIKDKQDFLDKKLRESKLMSNNLFLVFVAYKDLNLLDVYAKTREETAFKKFHSYDICSNSGQLGPKRTQGDEQVPEGFYYINRFNPSSMFYLSLGLNYPNVADKRKSKASNLGGDIFIHGDCVTAGCLPMTDDHIKEIYLLAVHAKNNGQSQIPVYVFPFKMTEENVINYKKKYKNQQELHSFWDNLKDGYDKFIKDPQALNFTVDEKGDYIFKN